MSSPVQWMVVVAGIALFVLVLELVRRRRLTEEYSLIWLLSSLVLIALSLARGAIDAVALRLGILYGPALLLLVLGFLVLIAALHFSLVVSRQRREIERLIEEVALLDARVRQLQDLLAPTRESAGASARR